MDPEEQRRDDGERPIVFVSVGTDHHRFDRLVAMMTAWAEEHPEVAVRAQTGHTPAPAALDAVAFMAAEEVAAEYRRARAVVCHGGPSTIMEARAAGHVPIVVARDPQRGEHVDGHQLRFVGQIGDHGVIVAVQRPDELAEALDGALARGPVADPAARRPEAEAAIARIGELLDDLAMRGRRARAGRST